MALEDFKTLKVGTVLKWTFSSVAMPVDQNKVQERYDMVESIDQLEDRMIAKDNQALWRRVIGIKKEREGSHADFLDRLFSRLKDKDPSEYFIRRDPLDEYYDQGRAIDLEGRELVLLEDVQADRPMMHEFDINPDLYVTIKAGILREDGTWQLGDPYLNLHFNSRSTPEKEMPVIMRDENNTPRVLNEERRFG